MKLQIAPEGRFISLILLLCALVFLFMKIWLVALICLLSLLFICFFFRDPERKIVQNTAEILAPADGTVIMIDDKASPFGGEIQTRICIFMSVTNVHVNRMPVTGKIEKMAYFPGEFNIASKDKASSANERLAYLIDSFGNKLTMVQIAGFVARRIVSYVKEGLTLDQGERFGLIQLGSRVDIYIPKTFTTSINIGDKTKAGVTTIGKR